MPNHRFHATVITCSALLTVAAPAAARERPNIILCMTDDQGWGDTGYNGHKILKTPHLDAMAAEGLVFERFYAAAPVCSPTRGSCLTGRHPFRYGVFFANTGHLPAEEITLAEILKEHGYATGHFGKWHIGTLTKTEKDSNRGGPGGANHYSPPWENGFDVCFSTEAKVPTWDPLLRPKSAKGGAWWDPVEDAADAVPYGTSYWTALDRKVTANTRGDDSRVIMDRAIPFMRDAAQKKQPFFAVIWYHTPHLPVVSGKKFTEPYSDHDKHAQHYYGCLAAMDEQIGRLRAELKTLNVAADTMLWFCADNGPEGSDKSPGTTGGLRGRKRSLYEGGVRVPGILVWPAKITRHRRTNVPAVTSDYLPTILDVLDAKLPDDRPLDGVSLLPLIHGEMSERPRPIFFESGGQLAVTGNRFKLYGKSGGKKNGGVGTPAFQLFDLVGHPREKTDHAAQHPQKVKAMTSELEAWRDSCQKSRNGEDY